LKVLLNATAGTGPRTIVDRNPRKMGVTDEDLIAAAAVSSPAIEEPAGLADRVTSLPKDG
jgi:hypothetical protein